MSNCYEYCGQYCWTQEQDVFHTPVQHYRSDKDNALKWDETDKGR